MHHLRTVCHVTYQGNKQKVIYSKRLKKVVIARTPHLMRGTWQSHEIASLRSQ
jgi:hypothetical protein